MLVLQAIMLSLVASQLFAERFYVPANLQTFKSESLPVPACLGVDDRGSAKIGRCTPESTNDDLIYALRMDVSCGSDQVWFSMPTRGRIDQEGVVEFTTPNGAERVTVSVAHQLRAVGYEMHDIRLGTPVDVWMGHEMPLMDGCGSQFYYGGFAAFCEEIVTAEPVRWPGMGDTLRFSLPRSWLWDYLAERQRTSAAHDAGSGVPETAWTRIMIQTVADPGASKFGDNAFSTSTGGGIRNRYLRPIFAIPHWILSGMATYRGIPIQSSFNAHEKHWPKHLRLDLNRLQAIHDLCPDSVIEPTDGPAADQPAEVSAARQAVRRLSLTDAWSIHRSRTLEEFIQSSQ